MLINWGLGNHQWLYRLRLKLAGKLVQSFNQASPQNRQVPAKRAIFVTKTLVSRVIIY
jgi:hypothetical protein